MDDCLRTEIFGWLKGRADAVGFAPVERFHEAPTNHHPSRILQRCRDRHCLRTTCAKGVLELSRIWSLFTPQKYKSYPYLDELAMNLAKPIEARGYLAAQIPSFGPLVYHET